jgi:hypothetical protein
MPTAAGVPVKIRSPGSISTAEISAMRRGMEDDPVVRSSCTVCRRPSKREVVAIGDLIRRDQPGPGRPVAPVRLAQRELAAGRELHPAVGDVLADAEPGHVVPAVGLVDPVGPPAHDHDQLDLPVDHLARQLDVGEGRSERRRVLGEHRGDRRQVHADSAAGWR